MTVFDLNGTLAAAEVVTKAIAEAERLHGKARSLVDCAGIGPPVKVIGRAFS